MESSVIVFEFISFFLSLLAAVILLFINKEQRHASRMLALFLLILALLNLNGVFLNSQLFLEFPRLHKLTLPFTLLIAPVAYLYMRSVLKGELKLKKYDWLFLLPAVLYAVNMVPYYTMPIEEKQAHLIKFYANRSMQGTFNEGILPAYTFPFIRLVWSIIFIVINARLINKFRKHATEQILNDNRILLRWCYTFNGLLIGLGSASLLNSILAPILKTNVIISEFALGISALIICLALFIRPKILYGVLSRSRAINKNGQALQHVEEIAVPLSVPLSKINGIAKKENTETLPIVINQSDTHRYKKTIETFFQQQKPFLQTDYSLEQMVDETKIPRYILSAFINREYGMGFREFLNRYRVDHFKENLDTPDWKNLTLEAIAELCGFSNRTTFIKNFKEITGLTPSAYIKKEMNRDPDPMPEIKGMNMQERIKQGA